MTFQIMIEASRDSNGHTLTKWSLQWVLRVIGFNLLISTIVVGVDHVKGSAENRQHYLNDTISQIDNSEDLFDHQNGQQVWSELLEDYVVRQASARRISKELPFSMNSISPNDLDRSQPSGIGNQIIGNNLGFQQNNPHNIYNKYHSSSYKRYIPTNNGIYINQRENEDENELDPHKRRPVQIVRPQFRPMTSNQMIKQYLPMHSPQNHFGGINIGGGEQTVRAITENDLYLLGAIEKLVYRVDYLESRIRRAEQLIYYLMAGNNHKEVRDPCPINFTRISDICYHINVQTQANWKTANTACKALHSHLAEFEKSTESEELMAFLLNQPRYRGHDFWLGGLNPGLLWIWSNSAKPVNPNMNLTSIVMSQQQGSNGNASKSDSTEKSDADADVDADALPDPTTNETILNNTFVIPGPGRCLRFSYNSTKHSYIYQGQECTSRHYYICEYEDKTLDNKIQRIARNLKLFDVEEN